MLNNKKIMIGPNELDLKETINNNKYQRKVIVVDEYEFEDIAAEFLNCDAYLKLSEETHHGITRLRHSFKVAKATYQIAKSLGLDYKSATRAAFLHDFFLNSDMLHEDKAIDKAKLHPKIALLNSQKYFNINEKEADAIVNHMYPLTPKKPETMEGITLSCVDKGVAISDRIVAFCQKTQSLAKKIRLFSFF